MLFSRFTSYTQKQFCLFHRLLVVKSVVRTAVLALLEKTFSVQISILEQDIQGISDLFFSK